MLGGRYEKRMCTKILGQPTDSVAVLPLIMGDGLVPVINTFKFKTFHIQPVESPFMEMAQKKKNTCLFIN